MADTNSPDLLADQSPFAVYSEADLAAIATMAVHLPLGQAAQARLDAIHTARNAAAAKAKEEADNRLIGAVISDTPVGRAKFAALLEVIEADDGSPAFDDAIRLLERLAELRHGFALQNLGILYQDGRGGKPRDPAHAAILFRRGAQAGCFHCMCQLGRLYERGHGVERDIAEAMRWFEQARHGSLLATDGLLRLWHKGHGGALVRHDFKTLHTEMLGLYELAWESQARDRHQKKLGEFYSLLIWQYYQDFGHTKI